MGLYYQLVCDELKERIDPGNINDLGIKASAIAAPEHPLGSVAVFAMLKRWGDKPVRLVNDESDDPAYWEYQNVTKNVLQDYNACYDTNLQFTG